jgi:hypothetical protein
MYKQEVLLPCMPVLICAEHNTKRALRSRKGFAFPPFLIIEQGETLQEWSGVSRQEVAVLKMAICIVKLLDGLHSRGKVHRNIHPGHIVKVMPAGEWRLQGLGDAAVIGERLCTLLSCIPFCH